MADQQTNQSSDEKVKTLQRKTNETRRTGSVDAVIEALRADPLFPTASEIVHWRDPIRSGLVFAIVTLTWFLLSMANYSVTTLIAYLYLGLFLTSFGLVQYSNFSGKPHLLKARLTDINDVITRDEAVSHAEVAYKFVDAVVLLGRDALFFTDVVFSLKAFGVALLVAILGNIFSLPTLLFIGAVILFAVPRVYEEKKAQIDAAIAQGLSVANAKLAPIIAKAPLEKLKLKQE